MDTKTPEVTLYKPDFSQMELQLATEIMAGFPSPADDYMHESLDLKDLIRHPEATFYGRIAGDSMIEAGIRQGDLIVIDRSLEAEDGDIVVAWVNDGFTIKYLDRSHKADGYIELRPANPEFKPIRIEAGDNFIVWGVVIWSIKMWRH